MNSVAIIGGGITGLTAAFRLQQQGIPVTLFESSPRVGGVIQSIRQDGFLAEFGPNTILETSPKIISLVHDLGLDERRMYSDPGAEKRFLVRGGKPVQMPGSPVAFFLTPLFSIGAKLRLLREPFIRRSHPDLEENLADFVLRRLGQEFLDYAINPFVAGVYAGDPARLSVKQAFPKLHEIEQRYGSLIKGQILGARERKRRKEVSKQNAKKVSFDEGLQVLIDTLQGKLGASVRLGTKVTRLERTASGWAAVSRAGDREERSEHSAVLYAGTAYRLDELQIAAPGFPSLASLSEIHYPPVASVVLGFRREDVPHPLDGFGVLIPEVERFHILGTLFSSSLFPNRAPSGHVLLTSYAGGVRDPDLALRDANDLYKITTKDLQRLLGVKGEPTFRHHRLYPRAIPQYEVGYGRYRDLMKRAESAAPGLFLAGHYRDGISLGDSMVSGHDVASRIAQHLKPPTA
jgi:oxygen-dependent protoporphyrinogen oxidase